MKRRWSMALLGSALVLVLALAACGSDDESDNTDTDLEQGVQNLATDVADTADQAGDVLETAATEAAGALEQAATQASDTAADVGDELEQAGTEIAQTVSQEDIDNADAGHGEELFSANCASCHSIESDQVIVGPSLQDIGNDAGNMVEGMDAVAYLHQSLVDPGAYVVEGFDNIMPSFADWPESDINDTIAFLMTLKTDS
ncbi:MAG TPA: cytochrome c [Aggregatilinea sp.]|uniref:c-type cytochrome n=1 Tax=Aggregatilinea sp. TaxID=2806333 RepID=UPI002C60A9A2|nr:cytochrome c [Aggregatilinea sp.]HML23826.1 cytochrome c [Aggregatilinea sp.]